MSPVWDSELSGEKATKLGSLPPMYCPSLVKARVAALQHHTVSDGETPSKVLADTRLQRLHRSHGRLGGAGDTRLCASASQVEEVPGVEDSVAVGLRAEGDVKVVLFVKLTQPAPGWHTADTGGGAQVSD